MITASEWNELRKMREGEPRSASESAPMTNDDADFWRSIKIDRENEPATGHRAVQPRSCDAKRRKRKGAA